MDALFKEPAPARIRDAVARIESQTAAEIVVTADRVAGDHRAADLTVAAVLALATLLALLYLPTPFALASFPIDVTLAFLAGSYLTRFVPPLRRLVAGRKALDAAADRGARVAFYDQGISRTTGRTGILVYIAGFERHARVLCDVGVDEEAMGEPWQEVLRQLEAAMHADDLDAFVVAMDAMAPLLARILPIQDDDVNELPDGLLTA